MRKTIEREEETNANDYVAYLFSYLICPEDSVLTQLDSIVYVSRVAVVFAEHRESAIAKLADKIGAVRVNNPATLGTRAPHDRFYITDSTTIPADSAFYTSGKHPGGATRLGKISFTDMTIKEYKNRDGCLAIF